jgi:hypothetical protein
MGDGLADHGAPLGGNSSVKFQSGEEVYYRGEGKAISGQALGTEPQS